MKISLTFIMTFAPRKKTSRSKTKIRTSAWLKRTSEKLLKRTKLVRDKDGNAIGLSHMTSPVTGEYKGKKVIDTKKSTKKKKTRLATIP